MKKLVVLAAMLPMVAHAQVNIVGTIPNRDGGQITFLAHRGSCPEDQLVAYTNRSDGKVTLTGCYKYVSDKFFVLWSDGDLYTYDAEAFTLSEEARRYLKANP